MTPPLTLSFFASQRQSDAGAIMAAATLVIREVRDMVDEMFQKNEAWLPQFGKK